MKKLITLASVGVFLLSLQGASLAQEKAPAPAAPAVEKAAPAAPVAPKMEAPAAPKMEAPAAPKEEAAKATKKSKTKKAKAPKKTKKAKKVPEVRGHSQADGDPGSVPEFGPFLGDEFRPQI